MVLVQANTWYELPKKGASADYDYIQPEVEDLVRISKKAHSVGRWGAGVDVLAAGRRRDQTGARQQH